MYIIRKVSYNVEKQLRIWNLRIYLRNIQRLIIIIIILFPQRTAMPFVSEHRLKRLLEVVVSVGVGRVVENAESLGHGTTLTTASGSLCQKTRTILYVVFA